MIRLQIIALISLFVIMALCFVGFAGFAIAGLFSDAPLWYAGMSLCSGVTGFVLRIAFEWAIAEFFDVRNRVK